MPTGVVLISPSAAARRRQVGARHDAAGAERARQTCPPALSARAGSMSKIVSCPTPSVSDRVRHGRPGAAGADLHHRRAASGHAAAERLGEARPVGVVADPPAVPQHDRVDRAQRPRVVRELVSSGITACLQGWVMFSPSKPIRSAAVSSSGRASTPRPSCVQIDEPVDVAKALLPPLPARASPA